MIRTLSLFLILSSTIKADYLVNSLKLDKGTWHRQVIYYPQVDEPSSKLPIVIVSHGNGHHYEQYSYLQEHLASQGFITMSHSNRTGPGINSASMTTLENTDILLEELASLDDGRLAKIADTSRIAWVGHSRGGEGVVRAYTKLMNGEFVAQNFNAQTIKLISSIAPTTFLAADEVNPAKVNYHMFVGGADGDVSGRPSSVVMSMPIFERAIGQKQLTYVQGAGHNVFNDDSHDEGSGPDRLEREQVHHIAKAYYLALMKTYLLEDLNWLKYLEGHNTIIRPAKLSFDYIISNEFHIAKNRPETFVIDDFQLNPQLDKASSLAMVDYNVENTYEGTLQDQDSSFRFAESDFMNGMTRYIDGPVIPKESFSTGAGMNFSTTTGSRPSLIAQSLKHLALEQRKFLSTL